MGRGGGEAWNSGSYGESGSKNDVTMMRGMIRVIKKKERNWKSLRCLFILCFPFDGQEKEEGDSLIYCSPPDSCLSHLFSIRTAPLFPHPSPSIPSTDPAAAPAASASPLRSSPLSPILPWRIFLKFHSDLSLGLPMDRGSQLCLLLW